MPNSADKNQTTHFGYEEVPVAEKQQRVRQVFMSVASRYDLMNDVIDALGGVADEADPGMGEIVDGQEEVVNVALQGRGQGVDGEVAAPGVGLPIVGVGDAGVAAVGLDIGAQGRHLVAPGLPDCQHGAVFDADG
ncbi:MAG: class I SAM-dependent methyltransferase, partial [Proteobacteria bacterium]|nr:class I SAM-dependent methyltransferase [Pseudomonadota bacterium]